MRFAVARPERSHTAGATVAVAVLLLFGCGGSSSSSSTSSASAGSPSTTQASQTSQTTQGAGTFAATLAPVLDEFKAASQATGAALQRARSESDAQVTATFQQLSAKWAAAVSKLAALQPPPRFTAGFNRLKGQVSNVTADLGAIVSAGRSHNPAAAKAAATKLIKDILSAKATSTTLTNGTP